MRNSESIEKEIARLQAELSEAKRIEGLPRAEKTLQKYMETYSGNQLRQNHQFNELGLWRVKGEDPNCDLGGQHGNPFIGYYEGVLEDVLLTVVVHPTFWTWGGGGTVEKVEYTHVQPIKRQR